MTPRVDCQAGCGPPTTLPPGPQFPLRFFRRTLSPQLLGPWLTALETRTGSQYAATLQWGGRARGYSLGGEQTSPNLTLSMCICMWGRPLSRVHHALAEVGARHLHRVCECSGTHSAQLPPVHAPGHMHYLKPQGWPAGWAWATLARQISWAGSQPGPLGTDSGNPSYLGVLLPRGWGLGCHGSPA